MQSGIQVEIRIWAASGDRDSTSPPNARFAAAVRTSPNKGLSLITKVFIDLIVRIQLEIAPYKIPDFFVVINVRRLVFL